MRRAFFFALSLLSIETYGQQCPSVVWEDEFTGSTLDLNKWSYQVGDGCAEGICGWGNNELQSYQEANVTVSNGQLHITAKKERVRGASYTSGRIRTINKGDFTYGRMEARIKLPGGAGLWPAFWMLPTDEVYGGWPQSGEIDIMEFVASDVKRVLGTIHYGDPYPNNQHQGGTITLSQEGFPDAFHDFAIEWENGTIRWFMDGILYLTKTESDVAPYNWPFDQRFHFLLNVAVGGNLGGPVDDSIFPKVMDVEYVKVYDGFKPFISGDMVVANQEANVSYSVGNIPSNTSVSWSVPSGASIVSGQGTPNVVVNFGNSSGNVTASFTICSSQQLSIPVQVEAPYSKEYSFENFDQPATATLNTATGAFSEVANPSKTGVNTSELVGRYVRNSAEQYDVLVYNVSNITDASQYTSKAKKFYMDIYTNAPIGTDILLQLETSTATSTNYPSGRHSRYLGNTTTQNNWQRIAFELLDEPDASAADNGVTKMILLFASNTFTGDTYYFDNLDSYSAQNTANSPPSVLITSPQDGASFASGTTVAINAEANDADGSIAEVEFLVNGSSIGVDASSPYSINYTLGTGSYTLTARATDNGGATTTASGITVNGTSGTTSYLYVNSITISTVNAGGGRKYGVAAVTIRDSNGNAVSNATVTGTFSGTFSESKSAVTGADGVATLQTSSTAKGTVTISFCVTNVTHGSLSYDASQNTMTCSGSAARIAQSLEQDDALAQVETFPNPSKGNFQIRLLLRKESVVDFTLLDPTGREVSSIGIQRLPAGEHTLQFPSHVKRSGIFLVKGSVNGKQYLLRQVKTE